MKHQVNFELVKVTIDPVKYEIGSEIYLVYQYGKYLPAIDLIDLKRKKQVSTFASAGSFAAKLEDLRSVNNDVLKGAVIWLQRESAEKSAKYIVELA